MKSVDFSRFFNPLYVLIAGLLGGTVIVLMFSPFFPLSCNNSNMSFFCVPEFFVVFFLMAILWSMMAILFIPGCKMFLWLFQRNVVEKDKRQRSHRVAELVFIAIASGVATVLVTAAGYWLYPEVQSQWDRNVPRGVDRIIDINSVSLFVVFLPYMLGMFLVYSIVRETALRIQDKKQFKQVKPFNLINDLLTYRKMVQSLLTISGMLLSMVPLIVVSIRSVLIVIDPAFGKIYPVTYVVFQGLTYTLLLLFIYFPAYLELSIAGQHVRDILCPLDSMDNLKDTIDKRKALDGLLQTEVSFTSNLRSGILTLGPLISSLLVFLGIKL